MATDAMITYNSDLERELFKSLTTGEGTYSYNKQVRTKSTVRFAKDVADTTDRPRRKKLVRDSQKARESVGIPGSKRHNRYLNKMELIDKALSDSESELEIEVEFKVEYKSAFAVLFDDQRVHELWEPFVEVTEEEQANLFSQLFPETPRRRAKKSDFAASPEDCFKLLNRDEKRFLRKLTGHPVLEKFEELIFDFAMSRRDTATHKFTQYECLIFGLMSVYYSIPLSVEELGEGYAGLTLRKPQKGVKLPSERLSNYLKSLQQQQAS